MSVPVGGLSIVWKLIGRALGGPAIAVRSVWIATLSVAELLLELATVGLVNDIHRLKEALLQRTEAETETKKAKAQKELAEATEAANQANLHKRKDAFAKIERDQREAQAAKTKEEAKAIRMDAETKRLAAMQEAKARLIEAVSKLRGEGGEFMVDPDNLRRIIESGLPSNEDDQQKKIGSDGEG